MGFSREEVTLSQADPAASSALQSLVTGRLQVSHDGRRLRAPVQSAAGLATTVVRSLDEAGITVDDVDVHQPSLDDVFFALTGHPTEPGTDDTPGTEGVQTDLEVAHS